MSPTTKNAEFLLSEQCEQNVISKLIKILQVALHCSTGLQLEDGDGDVSSSTILNQTTLLSSSDLKFAGNLLAKLVNANETFLDDGIDKESIIQQSQNITTIVASKPATPTTVGGRSPHRLQHLEMIKVGVLIFVISIIMLTTCRMVFQLFIKFRPEKPQMH